MLRAVNADKRNYPDWLPYVLPYVLFLLLAWLGSKIDDVRYLSLGAQLVVVSVVVIWFWRDGAYPELELRPSARGIAAGVLGAVLWIAPEHYGLLDFLPKLGESEFDPHGAGESLFVPLVAVRTATAVLLVPVFEELLLRSFLLRYLDAIREDLDSFTAVPIGRFRWFSFLGVVVAMAVTHHRWLRGGLYSALMCLVLYREKRMGPVIWAHAVTNLLVIVYALLTGTWALS